MGYIEVGDLSYAFPGGHPLFERVTFRVRNGQHAALVGANGAGKTTLLRLLAGEETGHQGAIRVEGRLAHMRQLSSSTSPTTTVRDLLVSLAPAPIRTAAQQLADAEEAVRLPHGRAADLRYADALAAWGDAGGYEAEVLWDVCTVSAFGQSMDKAAARRVRELSGGEQKRLCLEALLRSDADVLLLDEPDNFLDIRGKRWLEDQLNTCDKTILYVSHDRELLARTSHVVVTLEGHGAWTHPSSFITYHEARQHRLELLDDEHRRHREERHRLVEIMKEYKRRAAISDAFASRAKAAESRLKRFDAERPPPEIPAGQRIDMRLDGGRTGRRALALRDLALTGLTDPVEAEIWFGERIGVVGPNGAGKSHFLRLIAGQTVAHTGEAVLGSRVVAGFFSQTHDAPDLRGQRISDILSGHGLDRGKSMRILRRYELHDTYDQHFETLSGGQQARLSILLLELGGATMLVLDEPTDNLDIASAEALEDALETFEGTVLAATHDRWFMRTFDRFLVFGSDGSVTESDQPELATATPIR